MSGSGLVAPVRAFLRRDTVRTMLEVLGLWTVAVSLPVLTTLGEHPEHFALRAADRADLLLLVTVIVLGPPLVIGALVAALRRAHRGVGDLVRAIVLAGLVALFAVQLVAARGGNARALAAVLGATVAGVVFLTVPTSLAWPRLLSLAAPLAFVVFLASPVGGLLRSGPHTLDTAPGNDRSVVMILLDELPASTILGPDGWVDGERFPAFARLAEHSTWYRDATTVAPFSEQAVPALLSGRYPAGEPTPSAADHPDNLFSLLGGSREMHVYEHFAMCEVDCGRASEPPRLSRLSDLLGDSYEVLRQRVFDEPFSGGIGFGPEQGPKEVDRFAAFIDSVDEYDGDPSLFFLHALLPHKPWQYLPDGTRYRAGGILFGRTDHPSGDASYGSEEAADYLYRRHLAQAMYSDRLLGEALDAIDDAGLWDDAVVVVTADHGEAFTVDEPRRVVTPGNVMEVAQVPLFVARPDVPGGWIVETPFSTIDIIPLVADALDLDLPYDVDGSAAGTTKRKIRLSSGAFLDIPPFAGLPEPDPALSRTPFAPRALEDRLGDPVGPVGPETPCVGTGHMIVDVVDDSPPVYVVGDLDGLGPPPHDIVVASGGRIAGATTTWLDEEGAVRFAALLDPALLDDGEPVPYVVDGDRTAPLCLAPSS